MDRTIGKEGTWCSLPKKLQDPELLSKPLSIKEWKAPLYHAHEFMKTEPSPGGVIRAESIWGGKWRWKWRCWGEGQLKGSPKLLCWTRRQKWWMPEKADVSWEWRSGEELPTDRRKQGKCSSGKARRSEGMAGLVPISGAQSRNPCRKQKSLHSWS